MTIYSLDVLLSLTGTSLLFHSGSNCSFLACTQISQEAGQVVCIPISFRIFHSLLQSLMAQTVKCLSTIRETWVWSLGWEDPLEKEMAAHSSTLSWKIPWTEEPGGLQSMGSQRVGHDWATPPPPPHSQRLWRSQWNRMKLAFSCFFDVPTDVGNLISGSPAFSKSLKVSGSSQLMYGWSLA